MLFRKISFPSFRPALKATSRRLPEPTLRRVLDRERQRADRTHSPLSLIHFDLLSRDEFLRNTLSQIIESRIRQTDAFGDYETSIAVVLPATSVDDAARVAEDITDAMRVHGRIGWRCLEYPSGNFRVCRENEPIRDSATQDGYQDYGNDPSRVYSLFVKPLPRWKRLIDVVVSATLLVLTAPILLLAAMAIKCTSPGPIIFAQRRRGLGGKPFTMYKLRTMYADAESRKAQLRPLSEQDGPAFKMKNDPRVTWVGKYLRKTCIDELPQLWNVLRGDMTLVGPRPLPCDEADACAEWQKRRLDVTPGLTCIWQATSGKERVPFAEWMRMDMRYIKDRSLLKDLKLLAKTFWAVIRHRASH